MEQREGEAGVDEEAKLLLMVRRNRLSYVEMMPPKLTAPEVEVQAVQELVSTSAGETPVAVYKPWQCSGVQLPVYVNFHGGGFIQGSAQDDEGWCREISAVVGCAVVNVEYRLAPEHKFPIALEESYEVLKWIHAQAEAKGFDRKRIAVGGNSAGGNLAAALCLLARRRREFSLCYQVLKFPPLDFLADPKHKGNKDTLLTPGAQVFFTKCYLRQGQDEGNPLASPLLAENLAGLPPALIIAAEFDPLRIENAAYRERLAAAGCDVTYKEFVGCGHSFTHFGPEPQAREAWQLIHEKLQQVFWQPGNLAADEN